MALMNDLVFGDISANDYGIYISGEGVYNAPSRDVELVNIPGRNGALTIDHNRYENITIEYPAFTFATSQADFRRIVNAYKNAIMSQLGYQKLIDTYNPYEYRMALYVEGLEFEPVHYGRAATFTLKFNCKPQRYLVDGDNEVTVTDGDTLVNPTLYDASPLLLVEGYGNINFNGYALTLTDDTYGIIKLFDTTTKSTYNYNRNRYLTNVVTFNRATINDGDTFTVDGIVVVNMSIRLPTAASSTPYFSSVSTSETSSYVSFDDSSARISVPLLSPSYVSFVPSFTVGEAESCDMTHTIDYTVKLGSATVESSTITLYVDVDYDGDNTVTLTVQTTYATNPSTYTNHYIEGTLVACYADSTRSVLGTPTYVDCELGECYKYVDGSVVDLNSYIDLGSYLPVLANGENTVTCDDTITSLVVIPRWWQL